MMKFLQSVIKITFGQFEERELKKFLRLGSILLMVIGIYWTIRTLKDSIFVQIVGKESIPYAKTVSVILMIPLVIVYSKLLNIMPKLKLLKILPSFFYGSIILVYSVFVYCFQFKLIKPSLFTIIAGYFLYFIVESFGSLIVALFWSFLAEITDVKSSKKGFPLIYALAQLGGIIFPFFLLRYIPKMLSIKTDAVAMFLVSVLLFLINPLAQYVSNNIPKDDLSEKTLEPESRPKLKKNSGFIEGLKLLVTKPYILGIFGSLGFFEIITTIFDFNFKYEAAKVYSGTELTSYYANYSSVVNIVTFTFLILGINKLTTKLSIKVSLAMVPICFAVALFGFYTIPKLEFLFWLMVSVKAINYSLNGPSLKQLYVPTSNDVKSKAQAWTETFGSRFSKQIGSNINMLPNYISHASYKLISTSIGAVLIILWFGTSLFLGNTYKKAVDSKTNVC